MKTMKVDAHGQIKNLPAHSLLTHEDAPTEVRDAFEARREALAAHTEAARVHRTAERTAQENTLHVRGERERWLGEVEAKVVDEATAKERARRAAKRAADRLVERLKEHADDVDALAARLTLQAHARMVDALVEAEEARSERVLDVGRNRSMVPDWSAVGGIGETARNMSDLDRADVLTDVHWLADLAGDRLGMVEAVDHSGGARRLLTTPRRAALLVERGGHGSRAWKITDEHEEGTK